MIDRRCLLSGTKDDLLAIGYKLGSDLQTGDRIYGFAVGKSGTTSKKIVLKLGTVSKQFTYDGSGFQFSMNEYSNYWYFMFKSYSNQIVSNDPSSYDYVNGYQGGSIKFRAALSLQVGSSNSSAYVRNGFYVCHLIDSFSISEGTYHNATLDQYITYQGGTNDITDEVLFLTEPVVLDLE